MNKCRVCGKILPVDVPDICADCYYEFHEDKEGLEAGMDFGRDLEDDEDWDADTIDEEETIERCD